MMGHEMGHVSARHSASRMTYSTIQQVGLLAVAVGMGIGGLEDYSGAALKAGALGSSMILLKYSRSDELEADRLGMEYMARLGYNPTNAIKAHQSLEHVADEYMKSLGKETGERSFFEEMMSTHPRTSIRIDELREMQGRLPSHIQKGDGTGRKRFNKKTAALREKNHTYLAHYDKATRAYKEDDLKEAERHLALAIEKEPDEPPFYVLKGFLLMKDGYYDNAEESFNKAIEIEPGYQPAKRGMGALLYFKKEYSESIRVLKGALDIYQGDLASHYYLGMSHYQKGDFKSARPYIESFARAAPKDEEVHSVLGTTYEFAGEFRRAYNSYQNQLRVSYDNKAGRFARERRELLGARIELSKGGEVKGVRPARYKPKKPKKAKKSKGSKKK